MTEPVNNQWLSEILIDLVWEIDSRRLQVHRDVLKIKDIYGVELDHAESLILSKLESIEQEAELYGRLHETIEMFQSGTIASYKYSQRHAELTEQISQLKLGVTT